MDFKLYKDLLYPPIVYYRAGVATVMAPQGNKTGKAFMKIMNDSKVLGFTLVTSGNALNVQLSYEFCEYMNQVAHREHGERAHKHFYEGAKYAVSKYDIDISAKGDDDDES